MICKLINQICRKISTAGDFNSLGFWGKPTRQHPITGHALLIWFSVPVAACIQNYTFLCSRVYRKFA